ncbi:MAG: hypothetical protein IJM72_02910 [Deltaproteobacteria bacterium]|nr:hypothetical protein [Deltaproteobacteria bacterium]
MPVLSGAPLSTGNAALSAPAFGNGENTESTVVPALRERPRRPVRGGWREDRSYPQMAVLTSSRRLKCRQQ